MNIATTLHSWDESVALFERRGLPVSSYENLYEEEYDVHSGALSVDGHFDLDTAELDGTGYIVDGDLTVSGAVLNIDDGCPALVVLGDLRAAAVYLEGDAKLIVRGSVHVEAFVGNMTDKLVMLHGDLRAGVTVLSSEFEPDLVEGTLHGPVLVPPYLADAYPGPAGAGMPAAEAVLVPEVLRAGADDSDGLRSFNTPGVHGGRLLSRIEAGLPVTLAAGRR
ncbi:hypothetical protein [Streptomyces sp. CBMA156]|uniref:hypothetical protein n=1 Tax=Streptomyces sp. CBMA156 TaxID=1930280 RepID=UPI001661D878|nr:hypothetical protein [Streptomyces sp. CBMA156]MBD0676537.1 hypothetical protein [Streptomyces sp. CBMA156]